MTDNGKPREACGVFGVVTGANGGQTDSPSAAPAADTYHALYALQHRGQTSAGIAVSDGAVLRYKKGDGLVQEVFDFDTLNTLTGHMAIGHVRYAARRGTSGVNAQPLVVETLGHHIALAFNGNLTNAGQLRIETENQGGIFQTTGDAEIILYAIVRKLLKTASLETAVLEVMPQLKGAFSILILTQDKLIAARDPHGFRPLCIGRRRRNAGGASIEEVFFASESCALDSVEAVFDRDVKPGEVVVAEPGRITSLSVRPAKRCSLCAFEFVYFARPDSVIDGQSVELSRYLAGQCLARRSPVDADVVIGVPDSGLSSALGYAQEAGVPYGMGFVKNRYIGRTFIQEAQWLRERSLKIKLNVLAPVVKGKRVVMVDDSIVRGTTTGRVVALVREAGAASVHMRISSPPYMHPCYFGTDIPNRDQLPASRYTVDEMAKMIGADSLAFLSLEDLPHTMPDLRIDWCDACFTGEYPVPVAREKAKRLE